MILKIGNRKSILIALKKLSDLFIDEALHMRRLIYSIERDKTKYKDLKDIKEFVKRNIGRFGV